MSGSSSKKQGKAKGGAPGSDGKELRFKLDAQLCIANAKELHRKLAKLPGEKREVLLDASEVEVVDTSGLQLLVALVLERRRRERPVRWKDPSDVVRGAAREFGLEGQLF